MKLATEIHWQLNSRFISFYRSVSCHHFPCNKAFLFRWNTFVRILALLHLCLLVISFPCQPDDMFLSLFRIPWQNSRLPLFLQPFMYCEAIHHMTGVKSWRSNHNRWIMSENPDLYIAVKSAVSKATFTQSHWKSPPLQKNWGETYMWIAVVNSVLVYICINYMKCQTSHPKYYDYMLGQSIIRQVQVLIK